MYEIWLGLNIVFETLRPMLAALALLGLTWLALLVVALRCPGAQWRKVLPAVVIFGVFSAIVIMVMGPTWTSSSLSQLTYWVDWAFLGSSALGLGALLAVLVWPALAWLTRRA
jgi:hypothetical protein